MNPFKWLWDKYRHTVNPLPDPPKHDRTERVKRQLGNEGIYLTGKEARIFENKIKDGLHHPVRLVPTPKLKEATRTINNKIRGNAVLDELARADRESRIILDPEKVKQITNTGRSNRA